MDQSLSQTVSGQPAAGASRRQFLATGTAAAAGLALASQARVARAAHSFGEDTIKIGLVGCGGRGTGAAAQLFDTTGKVQLVAVADAFQYRVDEALSRLSDEAQRLGQTSGFKKEDYLNVPKDRQFVGLDAYKQVMESDCDLVVLATPPGFRPDQFEAAINAGKHVFMEKPVAVDGPGVRKVLEVGKKAQAKNLAVAVGLQRHHDPGYIECVKRIKDGEIGDLTYTRVYWNSGGLWVRPRRTDATEMEYQVDNWYYFNWVCGDHIVEQHIHNIDVSNWLVGSHPAQVNGMGGRQVRVGKEFGQIFDHHACEYTYPNGVTMLSQCRHIDGAWSEVDEFAHGTKGMAHVGRQEIFDASGKRTWKYRGRPVDAHHQEQRNLIASLRKGEIPNEVETGAHSTLSAIMGRMATYSGKIIKWDEALNSNLSLAPERLAWDANPPVMPDGEGRYPVPKVGQETVL
jgi:myo-inositol 2-dehydrogenase / D-chiro-inositol 1-dehydrogenase